MSDCRKSGGNCQDIIDKWKKISDEQSQQLDKTLKDNPASALAWDKELAEGGLDMASRPAWMNNIPGAGAVGGVDLVMNGSVDPKNIIAAYWSGTLTRYTGFESTVLINAGSSAIVSYMDGKNPFLYGTIGGLGGAIGYGVGNKIIEPMLGEAINPTWKALQWDDIGMGVSQPYRLSPVPGIVGTSGGGIAGEIFNVTVDPSTPENNKNGAAK